MSSFNLAKKLSPAKKAWKSFKTKFQSKLQKLNTSKAIKTTKKYCINTFKYLISSKLYALISRSPSGSTRYHFYHHYHQYRRSTSSAIYIDELFQGDQEQCSKLEKMVASSSSSGNKAKIEETTTRIKHHQIVAPGLKIFEKKKIEKEGETSTIDAWKIPFLPHLRCVDERAKEFISKFRQEMKLQREQSIADFQEMLARGT